MVGEIWFELDFIWARAGHEQDEVLLTSRGKAEENGRAKMWSKEGKNGDQQSEGATSSWKAQTERGRERMEAKELRAGLPPVTLSWRSASKPEQWHHLQSGLWLLCWLLVLFARLSVLVMAWKFCPFKSSSMTWRHRKSTEISFVWKTKI